MSENLSKLKSKITDHRFTLTEITGKEKNILNLLIIIFLPLTLLVPIWLLLLIPFNLKLLAERSLGIVSIVVYLFSLLLVFLSLNTLRECIYLLKTKIILLLFLLYTLLCFGFFMAVPVFQLIPGSMLALYYARKFSLMKYNNPNLKIIIKHISIFTASVMLLICTTSSFIALTDPYTGANLKGMLHLHNFVFTQFRLIIICIFGGIALTALQFFASYLILTKQLKNLISSSEK